ncbi:hypothetical protein FQA39_LY11334 [Lamprigera yunnana]|nr:hypothetical protein FQA39_LY11334 [Lamprigera yunnana]
MVPVCTLTCKRIKNVYMHSFWQNKKKEKIVKEENLFIITKDQVRILLFRECDFRGRKLLFDSDSVQKVLLTNSPEISPASQEKYVEISNGYGYQYIKPFCDVGHLGEMIFGAVAMSYRGTSLKVHNLKSPSRVMCSQIFPSPRHSSRECQHRSSQGNVHSFATSSHSLDHSLRFDDSGTGSAASMSDRLSNQSAGSDAFLVCKGSYSVPLDVPLTNLSLNCNFSSSNVMEDSGFSGEQFCNSISSGPHSFPYCCPLHEGEQQSFSCGSLYKKWLRSTSTSLEHSSSSLTGSSSTDECILRSHPRSSKLGLAIIIELLPEQEQCMELFLMEHASLIESLVWRVRQSVEIAYIRHTSFVSLMCEVVSNTTQWLIDLFCGPQLSNHMWISLAPICDKLNSISKSEHFQNSDAYSSLNYVADSCNTNKEMCFTMSLRLLEDRFDKQTLNKKRTSASLGNLKSDSNFGDSSEPADKSSDFMFLNFTKFLCNELTTVGVKSSYSCDDKNFVAEKYVTELCELLDSIDVKHTNFFVSTLLTAVLTHHLGWVSTVLPPTLTEKEKISKLSNPCNPLWGQLTDLYGAIGHPTKVSHTIITGTNKSELISKILSSLTYFIRCSDVGRKCLKRIDIQEENKVVDCICQQNSCIPKENYKKYEDHLRELDISNNVVGKYKVLQDEINVLKSELEGSNIENIEMCNLSNKNAIASKTKSFNTELYCTKTNGLSRARTCITDLCEMNKAESDFHINRIYPKLEDLYCVEERNGINKCKQLKTSHVLLDKVKSLGIQAVDSIPLDKDKEYQLTNAIINEKVRKLCRVPPDALLYHTEKSDNVHLVDFHEASIQVQKVFAPKKIDMEKQMKSSDVYLKEDHIKTESNINKSDVVFVLGDNEELVGLRKKSQNPEQVKDNLNKRKASLTRATSLHLPSKSNSVKHDLPLKEKPQEETKPSTSWRSTELLCNVVTNHASTISLESEYEDGDCSNVQKKEFCRSQSVPPENKKRDADGEQKTKSKYRYAGVKFNFLQYPQIVTNYMRSKNLELSQLSLSEKNMKLNMFGDYPEFDFTNCNTQVEEVEILQTPSNASELEFTSDLVADAYEVQHAKEVTEQHAKMFHRNQLPNTVIREPNLLKKVPVIEHPLQRNDKVNKIFENEQFEFIENESCNQSNKMKIIELPMPKSNPIPLDSTATNYTSSLMRGICDRYISNMVLQGTSAPKSEWESLLRKDLSLAAKHPLLDQPVDEAVAIVANTDTWEVQILSSHTYIVDRGSSGVRVGMSQLVANMLESLLQMWKLRTPPQYCIMHIEQKLQEFCILSKSLSELLLATEFCSMDLLTSVLQLEINDVPLLMAVASTHTPQLAQKYGLSFH